LHGESITEQIEKGLKFFAHKPEYKKFIVYFQAFSNTYGTLEEIKSRYEEALSHPNVVGLSIGTRPDCLPDEVLDYIAELSKKYFILLEIGVESIHDKTLKLINRGHDYKTAEDAIFRAHKRGIRTAVHFILGLPSETRADILETAHKIASLPIDVVKLHQLQIIKNTALADLYEKDPASVPLFTLDEYLDLCAEIVKIIPKRICIERFVSQSPPELRLAPNWGIKNYQFVEKLKKTLLLL
jgi:radical SAM protein (TIGR01212 family)